MSHRIVFYTLLDSIVRLPPPNEIAGQGKGEYKQKGVLLK